MYQICIYELQKHCILQMNKKQFYNKVFSNEMTKTKICCNNFTDNQSEIGNI